MSSSNGVTKDAFNNSGTANGMASTYGNRAAANSSILTPTLNRMATAPQGYDPQTMANFNTAALQSIGGADAGAVGGGLQRAAATNNAGGYQAADLQSGRDASAALSNAALGVAGANAQYKERQQDTGIQGLEGMYGQNIGASEGALGLSNQALGVANQGKQVAMAPWLDGLKAYTTLGAAAMGAG